MLRARSLRFGSGLRKWLLVCVLLPWASSASAAPLLDQVSASVGPPPCTILFSQTLTRAQTFTVGIRGTLTQVDFLVSGGGTATFEIHSTVNGLPVLGSQPLGAAGVTFDLPVQDPPIHATADFSAAGIEVEVGDVLAIVLQPGALIPPYQPNTPQWHCLNSDYRYEDGSFYTTTGSTPTEFIDFVPRDTGFRTWVEPQAVADDPIPFDPDDRAARAVVLYPEITPCLTTGTNGLADPSCTVFAGGAGAVFATEPLIADLSWSGDIATLTLSPATVADYLLAVHGIVANTTSSMTLQFDVVTGDIVGGVVGGGTGDWFFQADLPTPQGALAFDWLNRTQTDRPFEGTVLIGTAFEKQVVATCATEGDAPAPSIAGGVCFLQQDISPGFDPLSNTLTAYAHRDAVFPIEDYSPEFDTLDFAIAEMSTPDAVPGLGFPGLLVTALLLAAFGSLGAMRSHRSAGTVLMGLLAATLALAGPARLASATQFEGTLELSISESFDASAPPPVWHRVLRTESARYALPEMSEMPMHSHGQRIRVEGELVGGVLEPSSISDAPGPAAGSQMPMAAMRTSVVPASDTLGAQSTLVTLLNFTNDLSQPYTLSEVTDMLLNEGVPTSTASYVREASYGRAWLSGGVAGWLQVGYDDTDCEVWTSDGMLDLIFAMDPLINFAIVDRWIIVIPPNANCGFVGVSSLGKEARTTNDGTVEFSRFILNGLDASSSAVAAHELGHGMGALQHSADYECGPDVVADDCSPGQTGSDELDAMASAASFGHFSAPNKEALHWLDTNLVEVTGAGGSYFIEPYETTSAGTKVLRVPAPWSIDDFRSASGYYLSYRTQTGFDAGFPELATPGLLIHLDGDFYQENDPAITGASLLLDATPGSGADQQSDSADAFLTPGQTFTDAVHGVSIEVIGIAGGDLEVSVTRSQFCGNGVVDESFGEECDGPALETETCESLGWTSGSLACGASCEFEFATCNGSRCALEHDFDPIEDLCIAELPLDPSVRALWWNHETWNGARNHTAGRLLDTYSTFRLYNHQTIDRSWVYRTSLPFDTSSIPDAANLVSAELSLHALTGQYQFANSHPSSADQLVLVQPTLTNPPIAEATDFVSFGSLNGPTEGAARIDVGDVQAPIDFDVEFELNTAGLSWIDPTGMSYFGLRAGYDVDDITIASEEPVLLLTFRSEASPTKGPKLSVRYVPVPEPTVTSGLLVGMAALVVLRRRRVAGRLG